MSTSSDTLTFGLKSFDLPKRSGWKYLLKRTVKSLGAVSDQFDEYDDLIQLNALIRHLEDMLKEVYKLKKIREERVICEDNPYLTVEEVSQILRVSEGTVREEIDSGKIPAAEIGKRKQRRILKSDLAKYLGVKKIIFKHSDAA